MNIFRVIETTQVSKSVELEDGKIKELLNKLYSDIWIEACYDPDNDETRKHARKLLPTITALNDILEFKK